MRQRLERRLSMSLLDAFDDPKIPLYAVAQSAQRFLVAGAVTRGVRRGEAVELDDDRALQQSLLVRLRGGSAHDELAARGEDRRCGELRVRGEFLGIVDRLVARNPIALCHECFSPIV